MAADDLDALAELMPFARDLGLIVDEASPDRVMTLGSGSVLRLPRSKPSGGYAQLRPGYEQVVTASPRTAALLRSWN